MRFLLIAAIVVAAHSTAPAAEPCPKAQAAAALALASSCDCPRGSPALCKGEVFDALAKAKVEMAAEAAGPAVAPSPRVKAKVCECKDSKCDDCPACECPKAVSPPDATAGPVLPAAFSDTNGCTWTPARGTDGSVYWTRSCPARR
jgi:hypothetical protein